MRFTPRRPSVFRSHVTALESLEARRLMAAGPQFEVAVRANVRDAAANASGRSVVLLTRNQTTTVDLEGWGKTTWDTEEVFARVYDASGAPAGPEFRVSDLQWEFDGQLGTPRPFYQLYDADVAMAGNGDFVVTWSKFVFASGEGTSGEAYTPLMARRYTAAGAPKGAAFELPRATIGGDLAMAADGSFVVSRDYFGFNRYDATGRLLSARELNPAGSESFFDGQIGHTAVAAAPDGRFVMAWTKYAPEPGAIGADYGSAIQAQRFDAAGQPLGSSFLVSNQSRVTEEFPSVDVNAAGEFAISWGADNNEYSLATEGPYVRRYDAAGNPRRGAFQLARPATGGSQSRSTAVAAGLALDDVGNLTAAWDQGPGQTFDGFGGFEADAFARRFAPSGDPVGDAFRVNATTAGGHTTPDLVVDAAGRVTAFWTAYYTQPGVVATTFGRRFTFEGGTPTPPPPPPPTATGAVSGAVFNDADADGNRDTGEAPLSGRRVYIDADRDSVFDSGERSVLTDASGNYRFSNLPAGTHRVRQVLPAGWRRTRPSSGYYDVTIPSAGGTFTGRNFANTQKVLVTGTVFNDLDGDGRRDAGEAGLGGRRVFLDADNDGRFDSGERSVLSDSSGNYKFTTLSAETYRVRVVQPSGWRGTTPSSGVHVLTLSAGQAATGRLFGQRRSG